MPQGFGRCKGIPLVKLFRIKVSARRGGGGPTDSAGGLVNRWEVLISTTRRHAGCVRSVKADELSSPAMRTKDR